MSNPDLQSLQLETPRLILRVPRLADFDAWAAMMADEEAARFIGGVAPREVTWRGLMTMIGAWQATGVSMFSVIEKESGRWVAGSGPWMPDGWPGPEVGWAIVRECWGRGYATEGATAAMDYAFERLGWADVIHTIEPENIASQQVARKLGSRNRGPGRMPPPFADARVDLWGQTRERVAAAPVGESRLTSRRRQGAKGDDAAQRPTGPNRRDDEVEPSAVGRIEIQQHAGRVAPIGDPRRHADVQRRGQQSTGVEASSEDGRVPEGPHRFAGRRHAHNTGALQQFVAAWTARADGQEPGTTRGARGTSRDGGVLAMDEGISARARRLSETAARDAATSSVPKWIAAMVGATGEWTARTLAEDRATDNDGVGCAYLAADHAVRLRRPMPSLAIRLSSVVGFSPSRRRRRHVRGRASRCSRGRADVLDLDVVERHRGLAARGVPAAAARRRDAGRSPGSPRARSRCAARARCPATRSAAAPRRLSLEIESIVLPNAARTRRRTPHQRRDVLAPLAQRRHGDREHVEPVEQILAERAVARPPARGRGSWRR